MAVRVGWEDKYYLSYQVTGITQAGTFTASDDGIGGKSPSGKCGLLLDEHPMLNPGVEHVNTDKATGLAEPRIGSGYEYIVGRKVPTLSIGSMGLTEYKLAIFAWLLFQKGASEAGTTPYQKTYTPPLAGNPDCEVWASIGRAIGSGSDGNSYAMHGCIVTQLGISGEEGGRMVLSAEVLGRSWVDTYDHTSSVATPEEVADHMFFNYTWSLGAYGISSYIQSFEITINNNAFTRLYGSQLPNAFVLGKFTSTGTLKLAMSASSVGDNDQLDNFVAGTDVALVGTYSNKASIHVNCHYTGGEIDPAEELMLNLPFEGVSDGSNNSVTLTASDSIDRGIP